MTNICITSYYGIRQSLKCAEIALSNIGYTVYDFALYELTVDTTRSTIECASLLIEYIIQNQIDILLLWCHNIDPDVLAQIKSSTRVLVVMYNWDDPFDWDLNHISDLCRSIDLAFVTSKQTQRYIDSGVENVHYLIPAFCQHTHRIPYDIPDYKKYECDISFCFTNLYTDDIYDQQYINRKQLVDNIYNYQDVYGYKFNIYGPDKFRTVYPKSYHGEIMYEDLNKIFYYSKINLCTHVMCTVDGYVNERTVLIGGSYGLLLVDDVLGISNIFNVNTEIIIIDKNNYINQIIEILQNYAKYEPRRKNLYVKCLNNYTYGHWAKHIDTAIKNIQW